MFPDYLLTHPHPDLRVAAEAAYAGGVIIRERNKEEVAIEEKGIGDLVSLIDREADQAICETLRRLRPEDALLSEELHPNIDHSLCERLWVIDPLDGTAAFLFGLPTEMVSVLIALRVQGETEVAVAYFPLTDEWYYAVRGGGAWKQNIRLSVPSARSLKEVWVDLNHYGDAQFESPEIERLRRALRVPGGARLLTSIGPNSGMALRLLGGPRHLSGIIHDNDPRHVKQGPWDTTAPQLIVEEAGGIFCALRSGCRYDPFTIEPILVATHLSLADEIRRLLK